MALNLTFLHGFSPKYINSVVPGGWSIGVEVLFYCMVPFLFRLVTNIRAALNFLLVTVLLAFCLFYAYRKLFTPTSELESYMYFWLPGQLPVFGLGMVAYFLTFQDGKNKIRDAFFPLAMVSLLVMFVLITDYPVFGVHVLFGMASALFVFLLKFQPFPGIVNRFTLLMGKISYSLYLSNYAAIYFLQKTGIYSFLGVEWAVIYR